MSALSNLALTRIRERCHAVAANDTSDSCGPDPHPGEQHQAPESAADVACMADELIALRGSTAALREAAERLGREVAAFARACGPICEGEPECPSAPYLDVDLFDMDALLALKLAREERLADAQADEYARTEAAPNPPKEPA